MTAGAPTPTHQRALDLRRQLDRLGFDWGCLGSFEAWLAFAYEVAGIEELDEHAALEVANFLDEAIATVFPATPLAGHFPPSAGTRPAAGSGA